MLRRYVLMRINVISMILAVLGAFFLPWVLNTRPEYHVLSNPFVLIILLTGFFFISKCGLAMADRRRLAYCGALGVLFTIFLVIGAELTLDGRLNLTLSAVWRRLAAIIGFAPIVVLLLVILVSKLPALWEKTSSLSFEKRLSNSKISNKRLFIAMFAFMTICWLPAFFAFYPGIFAYDAPTQIHQAITGTMSADHPLLHTWLLNSFLKLGNLFGSYNLGLALYSLFQMLALSSCAAYSVVYLRRFKVPYVYLILGTVFLAFSPVCAVLSVSATKDVLYTSLFVLLMLFITDIGVWPERFFNSIFMQLRLVVVIALMSLLRNNGILAFLFCIPFLIIAAKKNRIKMSALCVAGVAFFLLSSQLLTYASGASRGNVAEALSVPIQQVARVYNEKADTLDAYESEKILELLPNVDKYDPYLSDPVKNSFNNYAFSENTGYYAKLWLQLGVRHPDVYASSFLMNTLWLWYPDTQYPCAQSLIETTTKDNAYGISGASLAPAFQDFYSALISHATHREFPLKLLMPSVAVPVWVLLFATMICLYNAHEKRKHLSALMLPLGLCIFLLFAPIILVRYVFPLYIAMPFIIGIVLQKDATQGQTS